MGSGCIDPPFLTSVLGGGYWSASLHGRFTSGEMSPRTLWVCGWVGPRAGLVFMETRKMLLCRKSKPVAIPTELSRLPQEATLLTSIRKVRVRICSGTPTALSEIFRGFPKFLQGNSELVLQMRVGARSSVVGWATMLQAGSSRVRFPLR
jgi:hypothetical protein